MNRPPLPTRLTIPIRCDDGDTLTRPGHRAAPLRPRLCWTHDVVDQCPILQRIDDRPCRTRALLQGHAPRTRVDSQPQSTPRQRSRMGTVQRDRPHSRFTTRSKREGQASSCPHNETGTHSDLPNKDRTTRPQQSPLQGGGPPTANRGMSNAPIQLGDNETNENVKHIAHASVGQRTHAIRSRLIYRCAVPYRRRHRTAPAPAPASSTVPPSERRTV